MMELLVLVGVLLSATAFGLWRRATDGRMTSVSAGPAGPGAPTDGAEPQPGAGVGSRPGGGGEGQPGEGQPGDSEPIAGAGQVPEEGAPAAAGAAVAVLGPGDLGQPLGEQASLVQFSSAFCSPCRATRVVLADVAAMVPGVVHVEVDAESHLELVRRLDVTRTPTVLVLDSAGRIRSRATGAPRKADVIAALGQVV